MNQNQSTKSLETAIQAIDESLSKRFISLDPKGYFLIKINSKSREIIAEHYINDIDDQGRAIDPESGKPLDCHNKIMRSAKNIFTGRTAKEVGIKLTEGEGSHPISQLDHALYVGRELQRAEECLRNGNIYIQD
mgnify:CR=1 FL=1